MRKVSVPIRVPDDVLNAYRAGNTYDIVVEAKFDLARQPLCASILESAIGSFYWPAVIAAVESGTIGTPGAREVLIFDDPGFQVQLRNRRERRPCRASDDLSTLLGLGAAAVTSHQVADATACFDAALGLAPDSAFAEYGAAVAASGDSSRIRHYERAAELLPNLWEARLGLRISQTHAGEVDAAERVFRSILGENPPLPVRKRTYDQLVYLYDQRNNRSEAASAKRSYLLSAQELQARYRPSVDEWRLSFDTEDLASREEELGDYVDAADHFTNALNLSSHSKLASEAMRFHQDLGLLRSGKRLGREGEWKVGCAAWHRRIGALGLRFLTRDLESIDWGGKSVVDAEWEMSCGSFGKGLDLIEREMKRRTSRPFSFSSGVPQDTFYAEAPYLVLEREYRAVGQSEPADRVRALRQRIAPAQGNQATLDDILAESLGLVKQGRAFAAR